MSKLTRILKNINKDNRRLSKDQEKIILNWAKDAVEELNDIIKNKKLLLILVELGFKDAKSVSNEFIKVIGDKLYKDMVNILLKNKQ